MTELSKLVKPLDLSHVMRHAFLSGISAARNIPGHQEINGPELWLDYDPQPNPAYDRIIAALDPEALAKIRADALREAAELVDEFRRAPATAGLGCDPMIEAILALIDKEDQA